MSPARWAKIFSPFDALRGFDESIAAKEADYHNRTELLEDDLRELNRKLEILHNLTWNRNMARQNAVRISLRYFRPCTDTESASYGSGGTVETVTGTVWNVDAEISKTILVGQMKVAFDDIVSITAENAELFQRDDAYTGAC